MTTNTYDETPEKKAAAEETATRLDALWARYDRRGSVLLREIATTHDRTEIVTLAGRFNAAALLAAELEDDTYAIGDAVTSALGIFEDHADGSAGDARETAAITGLGRERAKALFVRGFLSELEAA